MDDLRFIKKLPPMMAGKKLEDALMILPDYDPEIAFETEAVRLMALSDMYKIFVPTQMAKEIYTRMYLSLLRSLEKKESKIAVKQYNENHKAVREQSYSGIIGGSDSFTIIGASGIGKSSAVTRAIQLLTAEEVIEIKKPFSKIIPCVLVQTPFDSSIKGLLYEILRVVDEKMGSKYYVNALRARSTTDMLIGAVSQVALTPSYIIMLLNGICRRRNNLKIIHNDNGFPSCDLNVVLGDALNLVHTDIVITNYDVSMRRNRSGFCKGFLKCSFTNGILGEWLVILIFINIAFQYFACCEKLKVCVTGFLFLCHFKASDIGITADGFCVQFVTAHFKRENQNILILLCNLRGNLKYPGCFAKAANGSHTNEL